MGYTHYWNHGEILPAEWERLVADAKRIIKAAGVPVANGLGRGKPQINGEEITLNGVEADGNEFETFTISPDYTDFAFCKTGLRPYDLVVSTILLRATLTIPDFVIRSDGTWEEWRDARNLYYRVFNEQTPDEIPFGRDD